MEDLKGGGIYRGSDKSWPGKKGAGKARRWRKSQIHFSWEQLISQERRGSRGRRGRGSTGGGGPSHNSKTFSDKLVATSQALFFILGFRRSWLVAWSASFQCRLWEEHRWTRSRLQITQRTDCSMWLSLATTMTVVFCKQGMYGISPSLHSSNITYNCGDLLTHTHTGLTNADHIYLSLSFI